MALPRASSTTADAGSYRLPPVRSTADGKPRRVGVEIEFAGLDLEVITRLVRRVFGGVEEQDSRYAAHVRRTRLGDFRVELDSLPLKQERHKALLERIGAGPGLTRAVDEVIEGVATQWIPHEIVAPPIALDDLPKLEALRAALCAAGARGTRTSVFYLFGFQLNPEVPSLEAPVLLRYLRAFLALSQWLRASIDVDTTRKLFSFADPFPDEYRALVLDRAYAPNHRQLIADYLEHNPTRNRALDMLPAFSMIDRDEVLAKVREPDRVKARPTFHYRLPNSLVDDPDWSFALEWNRWVEVESLAEDSSRLERASGDVLRSLDRSLERDEIMTMARSWGVTAP
ncbi:MAG: amidoligase family protein [Polyangiaceae bacterium]|nr:amidoligase family protein [Polyangiaceae bacterium]